MTTLPYEYDVFLSYRRHGEWPIWIKEHFRPIFETYLSEELGREARIFFDTSIESGSSWPEHLALAHARSAVLVPLWSKSYFTSPWCIAELALMYARERSCGYRTTSRNDVLILPASIHDGRDFPASAQQIQWCKLNNYANVRLNRHGPVAEALTEAIKAWVPKIGQAIENAPSSCDPLWHRLSLDKFIPLFERKFSSQLCVPTIGQR